MTCKCDIQLDKCRWPKCQYKDNVKTNQQATANHTAKMFNQSHTQWLASDGNPANEPKEIKMTRKEAIEKVNSVGYTYNGNGLVKVLEAFGLIKFDEEKSVVDEAKEYVRNYTLYDRQELAGVINMLIRHIEK